MRKLLVVTLVMATASVANAGLWLSVNGVVDPPDTSIAIAQSDIVTIDVYSDGQTSANTECYLSISGPATMDISEGLVTTAFGESGGAGDRIIELEEGLIYLDFCVTVVNPPNIPEGTVCDFLKLHCDGPGEVTLNLGSTPYGNEFDSQVIHQIPEPMTIVLLGLGGLMLSRRK